jgi:alpha-tubulin suppressor-like RCC1 family protein
MLLIKQIPVGKNLALRIVALSVLYYGCGSANQPVASTQSVRQSEAYQWQGVYAGAGITCGILERDLKCWGRTGRRMRDIPGHSLQQLSFGRNHACAINGGVVNCWGCMEGGEMGGSDDQCWGEGGGDGVYFPPLVNPHGVASGDSHSCVLDDIGVKCLGYNGDGETTVAQLDHPTALAAGMFFTCAIDSKGVQCWGKNTYGQLDAPLALDHPTVIAAGRDHACAIQDGQATCWGDNRYRQSTPPHLRNARALALGNTFSCALDDSGVQCWGKGAPSQIYAQPTAIAASYGFDDSDEHLCVLDGTQINCSGLGLDGDTLVPRPIVNPVEVFAGNEQNCVLEAAGTVYCWGANPKNMLDFPIFSNLKQLKFGSNHVCSLDDQGVQCFGYVKDIEPPTLTNPASIELGYERFMCGLDDHGVSCWGNNASGDYPQIDVPEDIKSPRSLSVGDHHACVIDGQEVRCWGSNNYGQLNTPEPEAGIPLMIESGYNTSCAIMRAAVGDPRGEYLYCWGRSTRETIDTIGEPPSLLLNPTAVALGNYYGCALDDYGLNCWGDEAIVTRIPKLKNPRKVSAGYGHVCAIDDEGVKCWGRGSHGENKAPI